MSIGDLPVIQLFTTSFLLAHLTTRLCRPLSLTATTQKVQTLHRPQKQTRQWPQQAPGQLSPASVWVDMWPSVV